MPGLIKKYKTIILYGIFGVLTTLINMLVFFVMDKVADTGVSNITAWFLSVVFAFFTNKYFVFEANEKKGFLFQLLTFFAARILSGVLDTVLVVVFIDFLEFNKLAVKIGSNIIVIVLNYVASKLIIFRKNRE